VVRHVSELISSLLDLLPLRIEMTHADLLRRDERFKSSIVGKERYLPSSEREWSRLQAEK